MARTPDPDKMKEALWRPLSEDRKAVHRATIERAVVDAVSYPRPLARARRRFSVIAVAAALLALPAGIAVAAEGALPGDALYPVKQVTEAVRSWVDDDIVAEHRVDELQDLILEAAEGERISEQLRRAIAEVDRLESDHPLRDRLAEVTAARGEDVGGSDAIADPSPTTTLPVDRPSGGPTEGSTTTSTRRSTTDTSTPSDRTTTTTVPAGTVVDSTTTTLAKTTTTTVIDRAKVRVLGRVTAGPTCPVERFPPDPACEDQPVPRARLVVFDGDGVRAASLESNEDGRFQLSLEPGTYLLVPQPYDGLLGTAPAQEFVVEADTVELLVEYDTGIR